MPNTAEYFAEQIAALNELSKKGTMEEKVIRTKMFNAGASLLDYDEEGACFFDANTGDAHKVPPSEKCRKIWSEFFEQVDPTLLGWLSSFGFKPPKQLKAKVPPPSSPKAKAVQKAVVQAKAEKAKNPEKIKKAAAQLASRRVKPKAEGWSNMALIGGGLLVGAGIYTFILSRKKKK